MNFDIKVVHYPDGLDSSRATQFHREIQGLVEAGVKIVLLDFNNVKFINSAGLMALVVALREIRTAGGKLFICSMNEQIRMVLELTGVAQFFETFANLEDFNNTVVLKK